MKLSDLVDMSSHHKSSDTSNMGSNNTANSSLVQPGRPRTSSFSIYGRQGNAEGDGGMMKRMNFGNEY